MQATHSIARSWCDVLFRGTEEQILQMMEWFSALNEGPLRDAVVELHASAGQLTIHAVHPFAAVWDELEDHGALPKDQFIFIARFLAVAAAEYITDARQAHKALGKVMGLEVVWKFRALSDEGRLAVEHLATDVTLPEWSGFQLT